MKSIIKKVKINYLTYFFILSACITGYYQMIIALILIIFFHELGHIITTKILNYEIIKVEILPFGGITKINKDVNTPIKDELLIAVSGIVFQLLLFLIIFFLKQNHLIRDSFFTIFKNYNLTILIFNLLPIIPLDGQYIFKSILEYIFPFKLSSNVNLMISFISLIIFGILNFIYHWDNLVIIVFLIYKGIEYFRDFKHLLNRFYLERCLKDYNFKKIKIIEGFNLRKMYKDKYHYFIKNNKMVDERQILAKKFDIKT